MVAGGTVTLLPGRGQRRSVGRGQRVGARTRCRRASRSCRRPARAGRARTSANVSVTCTRPTLATGATAPTITDRRDGAGAGRDADQHGDGLLHDRRPERRRTTPRRSSTTVTASADLSIVKTGPATVVGRRAASATRWWWRTPVRPTRRTCPCRHAAGRRDVRVGDGHRLDVHQHRQRVGDLHPADAGDGATAPTITIVVTAPAQAGVADEHGDGVGGDPRPQRRRTTPRPATTTVTASADLSIVKSGPATRDGGGQRHLLAGRGQRRSVGRGERVGAPTRCRPVSRSCPRPATGWACSNVGERVGDLHPGGAGGGDDGADDHDRGDGAGAGGDR